MQSELPFSIKDQWGSTPSESGLYVLRVQNRERGFSYSLAEITTVSKSDIVSHTMEFHGDVRDISAMRDLYPSVEFLGPL